LVNRILSTYNKFWQKIDDRRQFAFKAHKSKHVTVSLYHKIAKGTSLMKYVKVNGNISVYIGDLIYWSRRTIIFNLKTRTKAELLKQQNYKCLFCGKIFLPFDFIETNHNHITPIAKDRCDKKLFKAINKSISSFLVGMNLWGVLLE
jgi:5-methylcytosine-specific restriction endonuclease McrA